MFQELNMIPYLSVAENIYLGSYPKDARGNIQWKTLYEDAKTLLTDVGLDIDVHVRLGELGTASQQMISIARAVSSECKILVLDEPTSSLDQNEVLQLFKIIRRLQEKKIGIIFITHRLDEVFEICDAVTILRDGKYILTRPISEMSKSELVTNMVGRKVEEGRRNRADKDFAGEYLLEVNQLACFPKVRDVSFGVHKGEVLGLTGLLGSGRSETAQLIFGCTQPEKGTIIYNGKTVKKQTPEKAIANGIAFCTENRREEGIIPDMSVRDNIVLSSIRRISHGSVISRKERSSVVKQYIERLKIKTPSADQRIRLLSGGNQQKVILARWLATNPKLIILDEPTRGIDVGAKQEIEKLVQEFAKEGISIIYISSEIVELVRNCDRVIVLNDGVSVGEIKGNRISENSVFGYDCGRKRILRRIFMAKEHKIDISKLASRYGAVVFFFLLFFYNCLMTKNFVRINTIQNLFIQSFPILLIGFGMTLVIATGNIDISVGSAMAMSAMIFVLTIKAGASPIIAFVLTLLIGSAVGVLSGILVSRFKIQSMIVTMAMLYILRGVAKGICGGTTVNFKDEFLSSLSYTKIVNYIPVHVIVILVIYAVMYFAVEKTRYGVYIEAVGNNIKAADVSGINVVRITISVFVIGMLLSVLAGVEQGIMVMQADSNNIGLTKEFDAIAATVVGGTPMSGGKPNLVGTFFAALLLQLINMMVNMNNIYYAMAYIIKAIMIIGAVMINTFIGRRK